MDAEYQKTIHSKESWRHRVIVLLTIISLWLATPATCQIVQRMIDTLTAFEVIPENFALMTKLVSDTCLLSLYMLGFVIIAMIFASAWTALWLVDQAKTQAPKAGPGIGRIFHFLKSEIREIWDLMVRLWNGRQQSRKQTGAPAPADWKDVPSGPIDK